MSGDEFKKAEMIELHDAGVVIHVKGYSDGSIGWREFKESTGDSYTIEGFDIKDIAKSFGKELRNIHGNEKIEYRTFSINRNRIQVGGKEELNEGEGGQLIKQLWAIVRGPRLLEIKAVFGFGDDEEETQLVTYSGSYTVWWDSKELFTNGGRP